VRWRGAGRPSPAGLFEEMASSRALPANIVGPSRKGGQQDRQRRSIDNRSSAARPAPIRGSRSLFVAATIRAIEPAPSSRPPTLRMEPDCRARSIGVCACMGHVTISFENSVPPAGLLELAEVARHTPRWKGAFLVFRTAPLWIKTPPGWRAVSPRDERPARAPKHEDGWIASAQFIARDPISPGSAGGGGGAGVIAQKHA